MLLTQQTNFVRYFFVRQAAFALPAIISYERPHCLSLPSLHLAAQASTICLACRKLAMSVFERATSRGNEPFSSKTSSIYTAKRSSIFPSIYIRRISARYGQRMISWRIRLTSGVIFRLSYSLSRAAIRLHCASRRGIGHACTSLGHVQLDSQTTKVALRCEMTRAARLCSPECDHLTGCDAMVQMGVVRAPKQIFIQSSRSVLFMPSSSRKTMSQIITSTMAFRLVRCQ